MGAWGRGAFENDDAMDWVWELEGSTDERPLASAFNVVAEMAADDSFDVTEGANAIAAATILASALDGMTEGLPDEAVAYVDRWTGDPDPELIALAMVALDRATGSGSEVADLWDETDDGPAWRASIVDLRARLERFA